LVPAQNVTARTCAGVVVDRWLDAMHEHEMPEQDAHFFDNGQALDDKGVKMTGASLLVGALRTRARTPARTCARKQAPP
jgi:hypothetical protein